MFVAHSSLASHLPKWDLQGGAWRLLAVALVSALLLAPAMPAGAAQGSIDVDPPQAVAHGCLIEVTATANVHDPTTSSASAIFRIKPPGAQGFGGGYVAAAGAGGKVSARWELSVGREGTYTFMVTWGAAGSKYVGRQVDTPTATATVDACEDFPEPPIERKPPSLSEGYRENTETARDTAAITAGVTCLATGVAALATVASSWTGAGLGAGAAVTGFFGGMCAAAAMAYLAERAKLAQDPPDENYAQVPLVSARHLEPPTHCSRKIVEDECQQLLAAASQWVDAANRLLDTLLSTWTEANRRGSAAAAGDRNATELQEAADRVLTGQLAEDLQRQAAAGEQLRSALSSAGVGTIPLDMPAVAEQVRNLDIAPLLGDDVAAYAAQLGITRTDLAKDLKAGVIAATAGTRATNTDDILAPDVDTGGYLDAYHQLTRDDLVSLVEALVDQHALSAYRGNLLNSDIAAYDSGHCLANFVQDAGAVPDARVAEFLQTAAAALPVGCTEPMVLSVQPSQGPAHGGTRIVVRGINLSDVSAVLFNSTDGTDLHCTVSECAVTTPQGESDAAVYVQTHAGQQSTPTASTRFAYYSSTPAGPVHLPATSLLHEGGFEPPSSRVATGGYRVVEQQDAHELIGPDWTLHGGVDVVGLGAGSAAEGTQFIDLNGNTDEAGPASLSQKVATFAGHRYRLTFELAGNPNGEPQEKTVDAALGSTVQHLTFNVAGHSNEDLGWTEHALETTTCDTSLEVALNSTTPGARGPNVDAISVVDLGPDTAADCAAAPHDPPGNPGDDRGHFPLWALALAVLVILVIGGVFLARRRD